MATVAELRRENAEQRQANAVQRAQLDQLIAANAALTTQIARLNERVAELLSVVSKFDGGRV